MQGGQALAPQQASLVSSLDARNQTPVEEFVFLGFSGVPHGRIYLFFVFLIIYLVSLVGNTAIISLIQLDSRLHSPMYFFLSHLSCMDVCYLSVTVPKILVNFLRQRNTISYHQCMAQMFFLMAFAGSECALLAIMAYDRYAAICQPLRYGSLMSGQVHLHTSLAAKLSFCGSNRIGHIFCDVPPLLKIACSDTYVNEMALHLASVFMGLSPFLFIVLSYVYILSAILQIPSKTGRRKTFSTCTAHMIVVTIYFGMANINYNRPSAGYSLEIDTLISTLYCVVTPMLNPIIYSLRNKEVKEALQKLLERLKKRWTSNWWRGR